MKSHIIHHLQLQNHLSLPSRERGLKFLNIYFIKMLVIVAPLAGAWIEIAIGKALKLDQAVAPLAGAWIEIAVTCTPHSTTPVAPLAGAWIEIAVLMLYLSGLVGRSPRGSVD